MVGGGVVGGRVVGGGVVGGEVVAGGVVRGAWWWGGVVGMVGGGAQELVALAGAGAKCGGSGIRYVGGKE